MTFTPSPAATPAIQTRQQLDAVLENIAHLQRERDDLRRAQENEIAAVRQRYRAPLAELEHYLDLETSWAESWARGNPEAFAADRSLACAHATLGFRATPPRIERASRRWTWSRIALTLAGVAWGGRSLRVPPPPRPAPPPRPPPAPSRGATFASPPPSRPPQPLLLPPPQPQLRRPQPG